jgi:hypothetical protein
VLGLILNTFKDGLVRPRRGVWKAMPVCYGSDYCARMAVLQKRHTVVLAGEVVYLQPLVHANTWKRTLSVPIRFTPIAFTLLPCLRRRLLRYVRTGIYLTRIMLLLGSPY